MKKHLKPILFILIGASACLAVFQNCAMKSADKDKTAKMSQLSQKACTFNGKVVDIGETVIGYESSNGICKSEVRECTDEGFSGSYDYSFCDASGPAACIVSNDEFDISTIPSGNTASGFVTSSASTQSNCDSSEIPVTCTDGVLSSSNLYPSCHVSDEEIDDGGSNSGGSNNGGNSGGSTSGGSTSGGSTSGGSTSGGSTTGGSTNGSTNGGSTNGTIACSGSPAINQAQACVGGTGNQTRTRSYQCSNGTYIYGEWSAWNTSGCVTAPKVCASPFGSTLKEGESIKAYQAASVAFNQVCKSETRVCKNGVLSGSYTKKTCDVEDNPACAKGFTEPQLKAVLGSLPEGTGISRDAATANLFCKKKGCSSAKVITYCADGKFSSPGDNTVMKASGSNFTRITAVGNNTIYECWSDPKIVLTCYP